MNRLKTKANLKDLRKRSNKKSKRQAGAELCQAQVDLSWKPNTEIMTKKAYKRLWTLKRLKRQGASLDDLRDIYVKQVRSVLEFGVPVWSSGLTQKDASDIERVQKSFLHIALGNDYTDYQAALAESSLEMLSSRRTRLCKSFAVKTAKHPKHNHWFVKTKPGVNT